MQRRESGACLIRVRVRVRVRVRAKARARASVPPQAPTYRAWTWGRWPRGSSPVWAWHGRRRRCLLRSVRAIRQSAMAAGTAARLRLPPPQACASTSTTWGITHRRAPRRAATPQTHRRCCCRRCCYHCHRCAAAIVAAWDRRGTPGTCKRCSGSRHAASSTSFRTGWKRLRHRIAALGPLGREFATHASADLATSRLRLTVMLNIW